MRLYFLKQNNPGCLIYMKQLLLIFVGLLYCGLNTASAQVCLRKGTNKGIYVDRTVSRTEIVMQFGQPERTLAHEDEAANGFMHTYEYAQLSISVVDGILFDFGFDSSGYEVIVYDKYSLKVGGVIMLLSWIRFRGRRSGRESMRSRPSYFSSWREPIVSTILP